MHNNITLTISEIDVLEHALDDIITIIQQMKRDYPNL